MDEVKRLREQARKAEEFAKRNPTVATSKQFSEVAASFAQQADERERQLSGQQVAAEPTSDTTGATHPPLPAESTSTPASTSN